MSPLAGQQLSTKRLQKLMLLFFAVLLAVVLHVVVGAFLLWQRSAAEAPPEPPSFEVTLYAEPVAQQEEEPIIDEPEPEPEPEPVVPVEKVVKTPPKPTPAPKPTPQPTPSVAPKPAAPKTNTQADEKQSSATPTVSQADVDLERQWQHTVRRHIERRKRYPRQAQRMRQEGAPVVSFALDAKGNVSQVKITRSSGVPALDKEALAMIERSQPLPVPPASLVARKGGIIELTVPIEFSMRATRR